MVTQAPMSGSELRGKLIQTASIASLLEHGLVDLDPIVTHRFPTDRFEEAFALMDNRDGLVAKVVLEHPDD